jgi:hypothetical protein
MRTHQLPRRRFHLVDIENLAGEPRPPRASLCAARAAYETQAHLGPTDHVVVACHHGLGLEAGLAWPGSRLRWRSGVNGADLALLEIMETERIAERFDGIVLGSGDGIFADPIAVLVGLGVNVTVVARPEALSRRLRLAAGGHVVPFVLGTAPHGPAVGAIGMVA